ncbi:MAG: VOC family protein [Acidimicrobiia bacterium]
MDWKIGLIGIPVSDVERAKTFYRVRAVGQV